MKNITISSLAFMMILFTLGSTTYLTQDAFAANPTVTSFVANDPDDGDTVFSDGDTILIVFDIGTNATNGGTMTSTEFNANFTIAGTGAFGGTFSGVWQNSAKELLLTWTTIGGSTPIVGTTTIEEKGTTNIAASGGTNADLYSDTPKTLTGDFGLFVAATTRSGGDGCIGDCEEPTLGVNDFGRRIVENGFTYNGKPIDVERFFTPYPLVTVQVGKQNVAEFKIYENEGPDNISHFELAFGLAKGESIGMSKAVINWDKSWDGTETVTLVDPENVLENTQVITSKDICSEGSQQQCLIVKIIHTFRAPLDFNILGTNVWDTNRNAWQNYYNHGIEIVGESLNPAKEYDGIDKGHIYHLTETGKNIAVDEFGNSWTLKQGSWTKDFIANQRLADGYWKVMTRTHSEFVNYKETQANDAVSQLLAFCPTCLTSYADFEDAFSYEFPERINKLDDPEIQKNMTFESERAQKIMANMLDPSSYHK